MAWFLSYRLDWGVSGTWWSILLSTSLGLGLNWLYYKIGKWRHKVVVRPRVSPA